MRQKAYLDDLAFVGEVTSGVGEGGNIEWAVVCKNHMRDDGEVNLRESWDDFKHDLAILKEADIKTIYDGNKCPNLGEEEWIIAINPSTIRI